MRKSLKVIGLTSLVLLGGLFGCSRGVENVYSFKYHGQTATIKQDKWLLLPDNNWVQINEDKIYSGILTSDDNKLITIENGRLFKKYSVRNIK